MPPSLTDPTKEGAYRSAAMWLTMAPARSAIVKFPSALRGMSSWQRFGLALILGAVSALSFAPFEAFLVPFLTLPALTWLLDGVMRLRGKRKPPWRRTLPRAFGLGFGFGFGLHLAGLWWIGRSFLVDADAFAWALPFAVVLLPAGLALFTGLALVGTAALWTPDGLRSLTLALSLAAADWLRGTVLSGFPWNLWGHTLGLAPWPMQAASLIGVYGVGLVSLVIYCAPAALSDPYDRASPPGRKATLTFAAAMLLALCVFGAARLAGAQTAVVPQLLVRLVQPAIPQEEKWLPELRQQHFEQLLTLSATPLAMPVAPQTRGLLIWPESAFPFLIEENDVARAAIAELLPTNVWLLAGGLRAATLARDTNSERRVFNSVFAFDEAAATQAIYDKRRLVPFGEYLPFEAPLRRLGLRQLVTAPASFAAGDTPPLLAIPELPPLAVSICYEAIFPLFFNNLSVRPHAIVNVTNDAWFGHTPGPYQHLAQARFRAVEQGIPLLRVANTGISAVIDPYGNTRVKLNLKVKGVLDSPLPEKLPRTVFERFGWGVLIALHGGGLLILSINFRRFI